MGNGQSTLGQDHGPNTPNHSHSSSSSLSTRAQPAHSHYQPSPSIRPVLQPTTSYSSPLPRQQQPTPPASLSSSPSPRPSYTSVNRDDRDHTVFTHPAPLPLKRDNSTLKREAGSHSPIPTPSSSTGSVLPYIKAPRFTQQLQTTAEPTGDMWSRRDEVTSMTTTLSSLQETDSGAYRYIDDRRYRKIDGSQYCLPCDEEEATRLHDQHCTIRFGIQGNYLAPVSDLLRKGARVLDVGCGPGMWTMELAGEYPSTHIVGIDIAEQFPQEVKPKNCSFYKVNILDPKLPFEDNTFDYVFQRFMYLGIPGDRWASLVSELVRVTKPGGYIELTEMDPEHYRAGPEFKRYNDKLINILQARGVDPLSARKLDTLLVDAGLINVRKTFVSFPGGDWAGRLGQLTLAAWKASMLALKPHMTITCGISSEDYDAMMRTCMTECELYRTYENVHFSYGQKKPLPDEREKMYGNVTPS